VKLKIARISSVAAAAFFDGNGRALFKVGECFVAGQDDRRDFEVFDFVGDGRNDNFLP
jgi:hypothetical protein